MGVWIRIAGLALLVMAAIAAPVFVLQTVQQDREISASIVISTPPERVWQILTATHEYPKWNPFIQRITGQIASGSELSVVMVPPNGAAMTFHPLVLAAEPGRELRWRGQWLGGGLFDVEHRFLLEQIEKNATRFTQSEKFSGLLVGKFTSGLFDKTGIGFSLMNEALKRLAEGKPIEPPQKLK
ncbi:hypothetical protein CCP2SC5_230013 [Azospirillaceae bacterium]